MCIVKARSEVSRKTNPSLQIYQHFCYRHLSKRIIQGSSESCYIYIYIYLRESVEKERDKRESRGEQWLGEEWNLLKSPSPACKTN